MKYLYIDLPIKNNRFRDFSVLKQGDSLEVRLSELDYDFQRVFWNGINKVKCERITLSQRESGDAYGLIQIFTFN